MPRKMGVLFFMVGSSCIRIVLPDLPAAEKGTKKSSKLCGDSCLITSKTPRLPQEAEVAISSDSPPQIVPFATVGQLLVCPPRPVPFAAGTAFGVCPFPGPALHGIGSGYSWRDAPLSSGALMVLYFSRCQGKRSFFTKSPEKWQNFQWNHPSSGEKNGLASAFCQENFAKSLDKNTWQCYAEHTK